MVNEANPSARVFEEHVHLLLERLALPLVEHVLGLEGLVDGQINRIIRVRDAGRRGRFGVAGGHHLDDGRIVRIAARGRQVDEVLARLAAFLQRRGHPPMMRLAKPGHPPLVVRLWRRRRLRRRADLPIRHFLFDADGGLVGVRVEPPALQQQFIVVVVRRTTGSARRQRCGTSDARVTRPSLLFVGVMQMQLVQRDFVAAYAAAAAVAPQRHFSGFAKQLHLFGAIHIDAKRPRQHPAAAASMAFYARSAGKRSEEKSRTVRHRGGIDGDVNGRPVKV